MTILIDVKQENFLCNAAALSFDHFYNQWLLKIFKVRLSNKNSVSFMSIERDFFMPYQLQSFHQNLVLGEDRGGQFAHWDGSMCTNISTHLAVKSSSVFWMWLMKAVFFHQWSKLPLKLNGLCKTEQNCNPNPQRKLPKHEHTRRLPHTTTFKMFLTYYIREGLWIYWIWYNHAAIGLFIKGFRRSKWTHVAELSCHAHISSN